MTSRVGERRLVLRVLAYWDEVREDRAFARLDQIDPCCLGEDWLSCAVLKIEAPIHDSIFTHVGDSFVEQNLSDATFYLADMTSPLLKHAFGYMQQVIDRRVPMSFGGQIRLFHRAALVRSIALPLADDNETITHILAAANYRFRPVEGTIVPSDPADEVMLE